MKILFIGDIVARPGRGLVSKYLPDIKKEHNVDFVVANADNLAHGRGATTGTINEMLSAGVDFFTGGDHLFWHKGFEDEIDALPVLRPVNLPDTNPGRGYELVDLGEKGSVLVISLMGRTFLNEHLESPFAKVDEILEDFSGADGGGTSTSKPTAILVDFHAEATSEKYAMGFYLDGRVDALLGTHTHVPTCDNMVLPEGTMFVSDVGMTGIVDSILGVEKEIILRMFLTGRRQKFEWENTGRKAFRSVVLDTESKAIERVDIFEDEIS